MSNNLEFLAILNVLNEKLNSKLKFAIQNNIFSKIHISSPEPPISMDVLGQEMIISDNREIIITSTKNPFSAITNLFINVYMLLYDKYYKIIEKDVINTDNTGISKA